MDTQTKKTSLNIPAVILCVIIIAVAGVSYIRKNQDKMQIPVKPAVPVKEDCLQWAAAVEEGNIEKALAYATRLAGGCDMKGIPDPDYIKLAAEMKFSTMVYDSRFGKRDFSRWKDACLVRKTVSALKSGNDEIEDIFRAISAKIEVRPTPEGKLQASSISEILERGSGNTHEITRVLCEAFLQAGYETMTVSIFDDSNAVAHLLCEVRGKGKVAVVDARFKKVWQGYSFEKLMQDPTATSGVWPENIAKCAKKHVYGLPAEVQDYKIFNQNLQAALSSSGVEGVARFGMDPRGRIMKYLVNFQSPEKVQITYWRYPFIVMLSDPGFPADWKLNYDKLLEQK